MSYCAPNALFRAPGLRPHDLQAVNVKPRRRIKGAKVWNLDSIQSAIREHARDADEDEQVWTWSCT